jgi:lipopolysaccharide/colanic/teichoic acid biosynthesis glycosyltransferase
MNAKRVFDIILSLFGLILALPIMVAVAIAMAVCDTGPLFYWQTRIGLNKRPFEMIKFRSMVVDADTLGPHVTAKHDPRITPVGTFLRRSKLDELPELWNVLIGDMSLVGPRPEVPRYVEHYREDWDDVFSVRPGITDLATLQFRDEESVLEGVEDRERAYIEIVVPIKIQLARWYVDHQSIALDLRILVDTVLAITVGKILPKRFGTDWADIASEELHEQKIV